MELVMDDGEKTLGDGRKSHWEAGVSAAAGPCEQWLNLFKSQLPTTTVHKGRSWVLSYSQL